MRRRWRGLAVIALALACTLATVHLFSWDEILRSLRQADFTMLLLGSGGMLMLSFVARGVRWLLVTGIAPSPRLVASSTLANAAAAGLAVLTPFQLGEALKVKLAPRRDDSGWRHGMSGFVVERVLDLSCLVGIGVAGLAMRAGQPWLAIPCWLAPVACGLMLSLLSAHVDAAPLRLRPYLEAFRHRRRIVTAAAATIPLWLLTAGMWWCAVAALGIRLDPMELCVVLGGVMFATVASMTPSGIGVSELSTRGIMLWLGFPVADAEAAAIGLRLLSPLIAALGLACLWLATLLRHGR